MAGDVAGEEARWLPREMDDHFLVLYGSLNNWTICSLTVTDKLLVEDVDGNCRYSLKNLPFNFRSPSGMNCIILKFHIFCSS